MAKWLLQPLMAGVIWAPHSWRQGACVCVCFFLTLLFVSAKSLVRTASSIFVLMTASREVFQQQER